METFRLRPEDFYKAKGKTLIIFGIVGVVLFLGIMGYTTIENGVDFDDDIFLIILMCALAIMTIAISVAFTYKNYRKERDNWLSTQVEIDEEGLSVKTNKLNLRLQRTEITGILEYQNKGLHIQTADKYKGCFISKHLDRYDDLRNYLANWLSIESVVSRKAAYLLHILYLIICGVMSLIVFLSAEKYLVLPCAIVLLGGIITELWRTYRTKGPDLRIKSRSFVITLLLCFVIVMKTLSLFK